MMGEAFCLYCEREQPYICDQVDRFQSVRGVQFMYTERFAKCEVCRNPVYAPEVNDMNANERLSAYFAAKEANHHE